MLLYEDFEIKIDRQREGEEYLASVTTSWGDSVQETFVLPFEAERLEWLLVLIENVLWRSRHPSRRTRPADVRRIKKAGRQLYEALFQKEVRACYKANLTRAQQVGKGLRLKLGLDYTLTNVPWELMYNPDSRDFVALSTLTPVVRYLALPQSPKPLEVSLPLRILVVIANPCQPLLDVSVEKKRLLSALEEPREAGAVEIKFLEGQGTFSALQRILRQQQFHVLHFIGHGEYRAEDEEGVLILEDEQGRSWFINGQNLGRALRDHPPLRLVVLNACEGAKTSTTDPFAGMAAAIVSAGIPAVVAMQFDISDSGAIIFSREFYTSLADGYPLDAAVTEARKAMAALIKNPIEWSTPVLYMTIPDGMIFNLTEKMEERKQEKLGILYRQALIQMRKRAWDRSIDLFEEVLVIDPHYRDAPQKLAEAKTRKQIAEQPPPAPPPATAWPVYVLGGAAILLILLLCLMAYAGGIPFLRPTDTPTATFPPTATRTATPTLTATETTTLTPTDTVTPSPSLSPPTRPPAVSPPTQSPYQPPTRTPSWPTPTWTPKTPSWPTPTWPPTKPPLTPPPSTKPSPTWLPTEPPVRGQEVSPTEPPPTSPPPTEPPPTWPPTEPPPTEPPIWQQQPPPTELPPTLPPPTPTPGTLSWSSFGTSLDPSLFQKTVIDDLGSETMPCGVPVIVDGVVRVAALSHLAAQGWPQVNVHYLMPLADFA